MKKVRIYQLNESKEKARSLMFLDYDEVSRDLKLDLYKVVYDGEVEDDLNLDDIYQRFNIGRKPEGYKGRSLSVSDIVEVDGKYYYCDSYGWEEVEFPKQKKYIVTSDKVSYRSIHDTKEEAEAQAEKLNAEYYRHKVWNVEEVECEPDKGEYKAVVEYSDKRTCEKWLDTEKVFADSLEEANNEMTRRTKFGGTVISVEKKPVKFSRLPRKSTMINL